MIATMMGPKYLEATNDGSSISPTGGGEFPWIGDVEPSSMASMPYAGLDGSFYSAGSPVGFPTPWVGLPSTNTPRQQTTLHSPETPIVDQTLFSSPMGNYAYLDRSYGDFGSQDYPVGVIPAGQFVPQMDSRASIVIPPRYSIPSVPSPSLYAPGGMWSANTSPTMFLPTPPLADDSSEDSTPIPEDDDEIDDEDDYGIKREIEKERKPTPPPPKSKKRSHAQLRTASRAPKKRPNILPQRPSETVEDVKARAAHNQVEQQYRKRLNAHFERLLAALPSPGPSSGGGGRRDGIGEKRVSKAEVLDLATERIRLLEKQTARLERERRELREKLTGCVM